MKHMLIGISAVFVAIYFLIAAYGKFHATCGVLF